MGEYMKINLNTRLYEIDGKPIFRPILKMGSSGKTEVVGLEEYDVGKLFIDGLNFIDKQIAFNVEDIRKKGKLIERIRNNETDFTHDETILIKECLKYVILTADVLMQAEAVFDSKETEK